MRNQILTILSVCFAIQPVPFASAAPMLPAAANHNYHKHVGWQPAHYPIDGRYSSPRKYNVNHHERWIPNDSYMNTERLMEENSGHFNTRGSRGSPQYFHDEFIKYHSPAQYASNMYRKAKRGIDSLKRKMVGVKEEKPATGCKPAARRDGSTVTNPTETIVIDLNELECPAPSYVTVKATVTSTMYSTQTSFVTQTPAS